MTLNCNRVEVGRPYVGLVIPSQLLEKVHRWLVLSTQRLAGWSAPQHQANPCVYRGMGKQSTAQPYGWRPMDHDSCCNQRGEQSTKKGILASFCACVYQLHAAATHLQQPMSTGRGKSVERICTTPLLLNFVQAFFLSWSPTAMDKWWQRQVEVTAGSLLPWSPRRRLGCDGCFDVDLEWRLSVYPARVTKQPTTGQLSPEREGKGKAFLKKAHSTWIGS